MEYGKYLKTQGIKLHTCNEEGLKKRAMAVKHFERMNGFKRPLLVEVNVRENIAFVHYGKETRDIFPLFNCPFCGEEIVELKEV